LRINESDAKERIECFCTRHPLLALAGRDSRTGKGFVWVRTMRKHQVISEVIVTSGTTYIRCRDCLRFHSVTIKEGTKALVDVTPVDEAQERELVAGLK
jgi:hypothetical protein